MISRFSIFNSYPIILLLCVLFSCGKEQPTTVKTSGNTSEIGDAPEANPKTPKPKPALIKEQKAFSFKREIQLDTFSTFPPEIEGCACYYSNNKEAFEQEVYIYADDYHDQAFVILKGKLTKFTLDKVDTLPHKHTHKTWKNKNYELTIDSKQTGQIEETWQQQGTLKIKQKGGKETQISIYGECGC